MQRGQDPALAPFLQVLDDHVSAHPEQLQPMTTDLVARLDDLVGAVDSESSWWLAPSVFLAVLGLILGLQGRWLKHCSHPNSTYTAGLRYESDL